MRDEIEDLGLDYNDARLLRAIRRVSSMLCNVVGLFPLQTLSETVPATPTGRVVLSATPLRAITSIADPFNTLAVANYYSDTQAGVIQPVGWENSVVSYDYGGYGYGGIIGYNGFYTGNVLPPNSHLVTVVYQGGYVMPGQDGRDLPEDIEDGCIQLIREGVSNSGRNPQIQRETVEGAGQLQYFARRNYDKGLHPIVQQLIAAYGKVRF